MITECKQVGYLPNVSGLDVYRSKIKVDVYLDGGPRPTPG